MFSFRKSQERYWSMEALCRKKFLFNIHNCTLKLPLKLILFDYCYHLSPFLGNMEAKEWFYCICSSYHIHKNWVCGCPQCNRAKDNFSSTHFPLNRLNHKGTCIVDKNTLHLHSAAKVLTLSPYLSVLVFCNSPVSIYNLKLWKFNPF